MSSKTHVFAIAVEKYLMPDIDSVAFAENDAQKFVSAWQELGVDAANCKPLLSGQRGHVVIFALRYLNKLIYFDQLVI